MHVNAVMMLSTLARKVMVERLATSYTGQMLELLSVQTVGI